MSNKSLENLNTKLIVFKKLKILTRSLASNVLIYYENDKSFLKMFYFFFMQNRVKLILDSLEEEEENKTNKSFCVFLYFN